MNNPRFHAHLRRPVAGTLLCLSAALLCQSCVEGVSPPERRNVLLIVADTLRADHLGCYGFDRPTSPRLDALAGEGVRFSRFYTVVPSTLASFNSILTSLHPKDHGAYRNGRKPDPAVPRLPELFRRAGFETAAFVSSFCLGPRFGMSRGFERFDARFSRTTALRDNPEVRSAKDVTRAFLQWLEKRDRSRPYFTMIHYFDPHWPYDPPPRFMLRFGARKPRNGGGGVPTFLRAQRNLKRSGGVPGDFERNLHDLYCAEVAYVDQQIGRILDRIEERGETEETLVVFTADHGETFWEHDDYWNHGLFVYDTTLHVPLLIRCPGWVPGGRVLDSPACTLDLAPTLCALSGIEAPEAFEGKDLSGLLLQGKGASSSARPLFAEATMPWSVEEGAPRPNFRKAKCVRRGRWKYILFPFMKEERKELFDLETDPREETNRLEDEETKDLARELEALLTEWAGRSRNPRRERGALDEHDRKALENLGYTGGGH